MPPLFLCPSQKNNKGRGHQFEFYYCQLYGSITLVPQLPLGALILVAAGKLGRNVAGSGFRADATLRHAGHHGASIRVISLRTGDVFLSAVCRWAASGQRGGHGDWFLGLGTDATLRHAGGHGAAIGVISLGTGDVFLSAVRGWTFVCQAAGTEEENCKRWPHSDF